MTLAEKLRNEGKLEGLRGTIEIGITLKFSGDIDAVMFEVNNIDDLEILAKIRDTIKIAKDISEILAMLK